MVYQTLTSFDSVIVVESLPHGDLKSGTELFERTIAPAAASDGGLLAELHEPKNRDELFGVLVHVKQIAERYGRAPIIQLETHGSPQGLALANGNHIPWDDLVAPLAAVNEACRMNLTVLAGLCHGWSMIDILRPTGRAPVFSLMGPMKVVEAGELLKATQRLYEVLLKPPHDMRRALDAANESDVVADWKFRWISAEFMFCQVFRAYIEDVSQDHVRAERLNRLVADLARAQDLDVTETMRLRAEVGADLDNHQAWFDRYREHFLLLDRFPDAAGRFKLNFSDCLGETS